MVPNGTCRRLLSDFVVDTRVLQVFLDRFLHLIGSQYLVCADGVATGATPTATPATGVATETAGLLLVHSAYGVGE
jgi:hypothetical protein